MGVDNIITFDAHDPRVQNAIPLSGFDTVQPAYQFIKGLLRHVDGLHIDARHMMVISPDEGGMKRAVYIANVLGLDMGMFYKRRDYTRLVDGRNPQLAPQILGSSVDGKDLNNHEPNKSSGRIFVFCTFCLFTSGLEKFNQAYRDGLIDRVLTTNLIYQSPELLECPWYISCSMSKYSAFIIDTLNHVSSISDLLNPSARIQKIVNRYNENGLHINE